MAAEIQKADLTSAAISTLGWKAEQIDVIRRSVAKDANASELYQFLYLCKEYDLDPFKREIYFMKSGGNPSIITGIDGFRKSARRDPNYEGVQSFAVKEGDEFSVDAASYTVHHKFGAKRGKVIGAWARADAKGRKPVLVYVDFDEFNKKQMNWNSMPGVMIAKVAESHAIRRQFGLAGLYTKEEMGVADTQPVQVMDTSYVVRESAATDLPEDPLMSYVPAAPAETPAPQDEPPAEHVAPNWTAFWTSVRKLNWGGMGTKEQQAYINRQAADFFGCEVNASLTEVPGLDDSMLRQFADYLRTVVK